MGSLLKAGLAFGLAGLALGIVPNPQGGRLAQMRTEFAQARPAAVLADPVRR
jgi:hypothetical protein